MSRLKVLVRLMKELEDHLVVCMRCGMCQAVCPLFAETGREADVARGKLALLDGLAHEMIRDPKGVQERVNRCLLCGSCAANCPSGVKVLDVFIKARAILAGYSGLSPVKKTVFRGMLARPALFNQMLEWGVKFQAIFTKPVDDLLGTSCARFISPLFAKRHFKPLAKVPFHRRVSSLNTVAGISRLKVFFFVGCVIDKMFPHIAEAVLQVLGHHGVGVILPENQGCCGIPALSSGDTTTFNKLVRHNIERFSDESADYLITACATCTATIKKIWPTMIQQLSDREKERVIGIVEKTLDISQFLDEKVGLRKGTAHSEADRISVTYHDPCHLKKSLGVTAQPRAMIRSNTRYHLREMAEADWCCGCGGSFNLENYGISASIGKRKLENIRNSRCDVVATGCPACMLQISDMLSQGENLIQVKHSVEIYAEMLRRIS